MKTPVEAIKAARLRITPRKAWVKNWFAFDKENKECASSSPEACKWCAMGAFNSLNLPMKLRNRSIEAIEDVVSTELTKFNDAPSTTHKKLLAAFDEAIARLEAR